MKFVDLTAVAGGQNVVSGCGVGGEWRWQGDAIDGDIHAEDGAWCGQMVVAGLGQQHQMSPFAGMVGRVDGQELCFAGSCPFHQNDSAGLVQCR